MPKVSQDLCPLSAFIDGSICDETHHIKLAIGNCLDTALDSGVFLEAEVR